LEFSGFHAGGGGKMKKTFLFIAVAVLISYVSIEGFKLTHNPPVIIQEVEKPVIVEKIIDLTASERKEVFEATARKYGELLKENSLKYFLSGVSKEEVLDNTINAYTEKFIKNPNPPQCDRCGKRHW
jgi:hypothetical protein